MSLPAQVTFKEELTPEIRSQFQWMWSQLVTAFNAPLTPPYVEFNCVGLTVFPPITKGSLYILKATDSGLFYLLWLDPKTNVYHHSQMLP